MNISAYILEYLKLYGSAVVPNFGVFSLESSKAVINSENGIILPPANKIAFSSDYSVQSDDLSIFISQQKQMSLNTFKSDLKIQTDFWKKKLQSDGILEISGLGTVTLEDGFKICFKGQRVEFLHPDFYGLEEIKISDISTSAKKASAEGREKDYKFKISILWIFLIIIPLSGIFYIAYTQPELIFGKKSFEIEKAPVKAKMHEIKKDTVKSEAQNSLKPIVDSLKKDSAIIPAKPAVKTSAIIKE